MQILIKNLSRKSELMLSEESNIWVLGYVDWGVAEASHSSVTNTDTIGETVTETFFLPRDIEVVGWIVGEGQNEIDERKKILNRLINPQNEMQLEYSNYALVVKAENSVRYAVGDEEDNENMCKFTLNFVAHQPLFLLKNKLIKIEMNVKGSTVFPLVFKPTIIFGEYPTQALEVLDNRGDVNTGFVIKLIAVGDVLNPILKNNDTGEMIKLDFKMVSKDEITISTISGNKYIELNSNNETRDLIGTLQRGSILFGLKSGVNHLELAADENTENLEIELRYAPRFLEVQ